MNALIHSVAIVNATIADEVAATRMQSIVMRLGVCAMSIEAKLIAAGVKNLKEFGYPKCNAENILTDMIYKQFFISMLEDNKGKSKEIDAAIEALLTKCNGKT